MNVFYALVNHYREDGTSLMVMAYKQYEEDWGHWVLQAG